MAGGRAAPSRRVARVAAAIAAALFLLDSPPALAYIGPGAGFAFVSSFFVVFAAMLLAVLKLLTWPVRGLVGLARGLRSRRALARARARRVVILGLDGQDPELTDRFLAEGILPNFARLRDEGFDGVMVATVGAVLARVRYSKPPEALMNAVPPNPVAISRMSSNKVWLVSG